MSEVVNAYEDGADVVLLRRDGSRVVRSTVRADHALYLLRDEVPVDLQQGLRNSQRVRSMRAEGRWLRVGMSGPRDRAELAAERGGFFAERGIRTFEADVDPVRRHLTDAALAIQKPRRCYLDIETDSRASFKAAKAGEARVLSWAVTDDGGEMRSAVLAADANGAEVDLLGALWELLGGFDQVCAWNGDGFDFPVIAARSDLLRLRVDPRRWLWLDHLALFKRMNMHSAESGDEKRSMKLQSIAQATLGEGKDDFDSSKTWEAWAAGGAERERLLRYNAKDTDLLRRIEAKTGFAALLDTLADACGVFPETRGLNPTVQMDGFMLRLGLERGEHFATKRYREFAEQFAGAYVMQPKLKGVGRDVHVADFSALYPSIMLTWNMSPETKRDVPVNGPVPEGCCRAPLTGQGFDDTADGILTFAIRKLIALRKESNDKKASLPPGSAEWHEMDRRSTAYKVAVNSFYGVVGSPFSRFFDKRIAEAVTQNGKWLILQTASAAEERGWKVVYADTDSIFATGCTKAEFETFVAWCNAELYPRILREKAGCGRNEIKLAYEKAFDRIVFCSAKRYVGSYAHYKGKAPKPFPAEGEAFDPKRHSHPEVKGLEYKRGDAALLAGRLQEAAIMMLVRGEERVEAYRALLSRTLERVLNDGLEREEVVLSKSLSKGLGEYRPKAKKDGTAAAEPPHVQVARELLRRGRELGESSRVEYFVADGAAAPMRVLPGEDFGAEPFDRYYLWESLVYPPTGRLLSAAFPEVDWDGGGNGGTAYARVRPPKPRASRRGGAVPEEQLGLAIDAPKGSRDPFPGSEVRVAVPERLGEALLLDLKDLARLAAGGRSLVVEIGLESGATAVLQTQTRVSDRFEKDARALVEQHERHEGLWEAACHAAE